ncbi:hypothetical protein E2986_11021 [Frieseomelitta varia]|uniref:Uncharacterized protein n=1 Tax=Frieseomelitta varia TaxID=561572 RepID=A0A833RYG6_9HYME|nr:hypothetical protein E2986_11021 [Frieseomelitta varia]
MYHWHRRLDSRIIDNDQLIKRTSLYNKIQFPSELQSLALAADCGP